MPSKPGHSSITQADRKGRLGHDDGPKILSAGNVSGNQNSESRSVALVSAY